MSPASRYLTDAEARQMTRGELVDRIHAEMDAWKRRPPRTDAQRAAYNEMMRIMHAYVDVSAGLGSVRALLDGHADGYWESRPCDDPLPVIAAAVPDREKGRKS